MRVNILALVFWFLAMLHAARAADAEPVHPTTSATTTCAVCHGLNGNSTINVIPILAQQQATYLTKQLLDYRLGLRASPIMQPIAALLSDSDIAHLSADYAAAKNMGGSTPPAYYTLGARLYRGGIREREIPACSACHGPDGSGNSQAR